MQLLRYPVNYIGIVTNYSSDHQALDLAWHNKEHEDIMACADGKVINIWQDEDFGGGLSLKIQYDNGYASDFKHLSETLVKVGQTVKQGEVVAKMGNSGWACKGTHLHYNCYKNGARVNPATETYVFDGQEVCKDDKDKVLYYNADLPEIDTWLVINDEAGLYLLDSNKKKIGLYNYGTDVIFKGAGYTYKNNEYYYIQINGDKKLGYMAKQYLSEKYPKEEPNNNEAIKELNKTIDELNNKIALQDKQIKELEEYITNYKCKFDIEEDNYYKIKLYKGETLLIK